MQVHLVTEEEWATSRDQGLGASDIARVFTERVGELTLWAQKTGKEPVNFPPILGDYGTALEPVIAKHLNLRLGLPPEGDERDLCYRGADDGRRFRVIGPGPLFATPDLLLLPAPVDRAASIRMGGTPYPFCEGKTCDRVVAWKWDSGPDLYAMVQTQATMLCTAGAWTEARVAVLIGNGYDTRNDFQTYEVEADGDLQGEILRWAETFWDNVQRDIPPRPDGLAATLDTIRLLYPPAGKESRRQGVLPASLMKKYREWKRLDGVIDAAERQRSRHRQEIEFAMGQAGLEDATIAATADNPNPPRFLRLSYDRKAYEVPAGHVDQFREVK